MVGLLKGRFSKGVVGIGDWNWVSGFWMAADVDQKVNDVGESGG